MKEQYSTQQLNSHLPKVLKQIEQGNSIEITKKGEPFAVILSASEYQRLTAQTSHNAEPTLAPVTTKFSFWQSIQDFRALHDLKELELEADVFADIRDLSPGREMNF